MQPLRVLRFVVAQVREYVPVRGEVRHQAVVKRVPISTVDRHAHLGDSFRFYTAEKAPRSRQGELAVGATASRRHRRGSSVL